MRRDETLLEKEISIKQGRLKQKRLLRQVATARAQQEDMIQELTTVQDERGRSLYGTEAWDEGVDGNVPMKELFNLGENELRGIKIEAYNRIAAEERRQNGGRGTLNTARITAMTAHYRNMMSSLQNGVVGKFGNSNNEKLSQEEMDDQVISPLLVTARTTNATHRSHRSRAEDAPFDDPRFVVPREDRPTGLPSMFSAQSGFPSRSNDAETAQKSNPPKTFDVVAKNLQPPYAQPRNPIVTLQAKNLSNPAPPPLPPPSLRGLAGKPPVGRHSDDRPAKVAYRGVVESKVSEPIPRRAASKERERPSPKRKSGVRKSSIAISPRDTTKAPPKAKVPKFPALGAEAVRTSASVAVFPTEADTSPKQSPRKGRGSKISAMPPSDSAKAKR